MAIEYLGTLWDPSNTELEKGVSCIEYGVGDLAIRKLVIKKGSSFKTEIKPNDYLIVGISGKGVVRQINGNKITDVQFIAGNDMVQIGSGAECELISSINYNEDFVLMAITFAINGEGQLIS